ncbi:MAG: GNAT family N-acetyltransferase [Frankia sp.]
MTFGRPGRLEAGHDVSRFSSGEAALDDWLRRYARTNQAAGNATTFVSVKNDQVAGYFCLSTSAVARHDAVPRATKGGAPDPIPAILLGRLAVGAKFQGQGLGSHLLADAIRRALTVERLIGVRVMLAHAINSDAVAFYQRYGFQPSPVDPLTVMLLMKDARKPAG